MENVETPVAQQHATRDAEAGWVINRSGFVRTLLTSNSLLRTVQAVMVTLFLYAIYSAVTGPAAPPGQGAPQTNFGTVMFFSLWWSPVMILSLLLLGRVWCAVCPLGAIATQLQRFSKNRRFPMANAKRLGVSALLLSVILFTVARLPLYKFGVASTPVKAGWYFLAFLVAAALVTLVFERRAWCRYVCPVTAAMSAVSKLSPVEFRHASESGVACPTAEYRSAYLSTDHRCVYCLKCTQTQPEAPVRLRLRLPGAGIVREKLHVLDEAVMAVILFAVFPIDHVLGKLWGEMPAIRNAGPFLSKALPYYLDITATLAGFALLTWIGARLAGADYRLAFTRLGAAYVAMGITFSLGMTLSGLMSRGGNIVNTVAKEFGGSAVMPAALASDATLHAWTSFSNSWLIAIGAAWTLTLLVLVARQVAPGKAPVLAAPHVLALVPLNAWVILEMLARHGGH